MPSSKVTKASTDQGINNEEFSPTFHHINLFNHNTQGSKDQLAYGNNRERNTDESKGLANLREGKGGRRWTTENFQYSQGVKKTKSMDENIGKEEKNKSEKSMSIQQNDFGELSKLIYFGLEDAREETEKHKIVENLSKQLKEELELEIVMCKEQKRLIMMNIMRDKVNSPQSPQFSIENERNYGPEMGNFSPISLQTQEFDDNQRKRKCSEGNCYDQMKKYPNEGSHPEISPSFSDFEQVMSLKFIPLKNKTHLKSDCEKEISTNESTSPLSKISEFEKIVDELSVEEKAIYLYERKNRIKKQLDIERINFNRRENEMKEELTILRKEIKELESLKNIEYQTYKHTNPSFSRTNSTGNYTNHNTQITNPKNASVDQTQSNARVKALSFQMKLKRPSLFTKPKSNNIISQTKNVVNFNKQIKSPEKNGFIFPPKPPKTLASRPIREQKA